jgi:hypothetical protein
VTSGLLILALLQGVAATGPSAAPTAPPQSTVIAVILPPAPNASMLEALYRLRGEADSVGFELRLVEAAANVEPRAQLETVARGFAPAAVVALVGKSSEALPGDSPPGAPIGSMDVWFFDRATASTSVGHLTVDEEAGVRADRVLAVRVVDFIRARMFDSLVRKLAESKTKRRQVTTHELSGRGFVAVGGASTGSFSGMPAAFMPTLELGFAMRKWLRLTLGAGGLGTRPRRETTAGSARMDQTLVKASAMLMARTWWRLSPFVEVGAVAYFVSAHGVGYPGNVGYDPSGWSPGMHGSAGLGVVLSPRLVLQLTGGGMLLFREPKIFIADSEVARTGRPAWLASALLGVTF